MAKNRVKKADKCSQGYQKFYLFQCLVLGNFFLFTFVQFLSLLLRVVPVFSSALFLALNGLVHFVAPTFTLMELTYQPISLVWLFLLFSPCYRRGVFSNGPWRSYKVYTFKPNSGFSLFSPLRPLFDKYSLAIPSLSSSFLNFCM